MPAGWKTSRPNAGNEEFKLVTVDGRQDPMGNMKCSPQT
jgi:hypothetical protein